MNPREIIGKYYTEGTDLWRILWMHSEDVMHLALAIAAYNKSEEWDLNFIVEAAMLHDVGIFRTNAPRIYCVGDEPYLCHGIIGAKILREEGFFRHARVAERHTGTGITEKMIIENELPLPCKDYLPETKEEELICFADKFYSKTKLKQPHSIEKIKKSLAKFGLESVGRFETWNDRWLRGVNFENLLREIDRK